MPIFPLPEEPRDSGLVDPPDDGDKEGFGAYELPLELDDDALEPDLAPVGADVPPIGPVERVLPGSAAFGAGALNAVVGFATGAGAEVGLALGLAVGGAGLAGEGFAAGCGFF